MGKSLRGGYVAYIRVSTQKQGEHGVSLEAQREVIHGFAQREGLTISHWAEERESASKLGRPEFQKVLKLLQTHMADGLIFHKIDRGARNHVDWSDLRTLGERGYHVYFAVEGVDLRQAEHLLLADIHAAMASHYSRNLRQEVLKGMKGRLKQGIYPWAAPLGYLNQGGGQAKTPDPERATLIRTAFELYAVGAYSLNTLADHLGKVGLRTRQGKPVRVTLLNRILRNPFYAGIISVEGWNETYEGTHEPLVTMALFGQVQDRLNGRLIQRTRQHNFVFRRMLKCEHCPYSLIGERKKGRVYYRCHTKTCPTTGIREDAVELELQRKLLAIQFSKEERAYIRARVEELNLNDGDDRQKAVGALKLRRDQLAERLKRLTDARLDLEIERDEYGSRKEALLREQKLIEERLNGLETGDERPTLGDYLELCEHAWTLYSFAEPDIRRQLVEVFTSNRSVSGRNLEMTLAPPFSLIETRTKLLECGPERDMTRTLYVLLHELRAFLVSQTSESSSRLVALLKRIHPKEEKRKSETWKTNFRERWERLKRQTGEVEGSTRSAP